GSSLDVSPPRPKTSVPPCAGALVLPVPLDPVPPEGWQAASTKTAANRNEATADRRFDPILSLLDKIHHAAGPPRHLTDYRHNQIVKAKKESVAVEGRVGRANLWPARGSRASGPRRRRAPR